MSVGALVRGSCLPRIADHEIDNHTEHHSPASPLFGRLMTLQAGVEAEDGHLPEVQRMVCARCPLVVNSNDEQMQGRGLRTGARPAVARPGVVSRLVPRPTRLLKTAANFFDPWVSPRRPKRFEPVPLLTSNCRRPNHGNASRGCVGPGKRHHRPSVPPLGSRKSSILPIDARGTSGASIGKARSVAVRAL